MTAEEACHCGQPVAYGFDGDPTHHRGMCEDCDAARCDAYPQECPYRLTALAAGFDESAQFWRDVATSGAGIGADLGRMEAFEEAAQRVRAVLHPEREPFTARLADAWDQGCSHTDEPGSVVPCPRNPYRLHDLDDVAAEFGVDLDAT